jgi:hypothetical protein
MLAILTISVTQELTPIEQQFINLLGAGYDVTLTTGQGISMRDSPDDKYIRVVPWAAYGEETDLTINSPFNPQTWGCTFTTNSTDFKQFDCSGTWKSVNHLEIGEETTPAQDGCSSGFDIDITTEECRPFEIIQEEARTQCDDDVTCPTGSYTPPTESEKQIETLIKQNEISAADKRLIYFLESDEGAKCFQGQGTTSGIQSVRDFPIPTIETPIFEEIDGVMVDTGRTQTILDTTTVMTSIDFTGKLKEIKMFVRECVAQSILLNPQGGILSSADERLGYCDATTFDTPEESARKGCGYSVLTHADIAKKAPVYSQNRVNQESNMHDGSDRSATSPKICAMYSQISQRALGCPMETPDPNNTVKQTELYNYGSDIEQRVNIYEEDGGIEEANKLAKEAIREKISALLNQLNKLGN